MSVTDSIHEPAEASVVMDPQSAAELAQELALVAKSLFAQLLPSTATRAISGVPTLGTPATSDITPKHVQSPPADQAPAPIDYQSATTAIPVPEAPAPVAAVAIPVPSLPVPQMPEAQPVTQMSSIPVPDIGPDAGGRAAARGAPGRRAVQARAPLPGNARGDRLPRRVTHGQDTTRRPSTPDLARTGTFAQIRR